MGKVTVGNEGSKKVNTIRKAPEKIPSEPVIIEKIVQDPDTPKAIDNLRRAHAEDMEKVYNVISEQREQLSRDINITDEKIEEMYDEIMNELRTAPDKLEMSSYDDSEVIRVLDAQGRTIVNLRASQDEIEAYKKDVEEELNRQKKLNKYLMYGIVLTSVLSVLGIIL